MCGDEMAMEGYIRVLIVPEFGYRYAALIPNNAEKLRRVIGGEYECRFIDENVAVESAYLEPWRLRRQYKNQEFFGTFIIAGWNENGDFCSLNDDELRKWCQVF